MHKTKHFELNRRVKKERGAGMAGCQGLSSVFIYRGLRLQTHRSAHLQIVDSNRQARVGLKDSAAP